MTLFKNLKVVGSHVMGGKEKKSMMQKYGGSSFLSVENTFIVNKCKDKKVVITQENKPIIFIYNNIYIPTLQHIRMEPDVLKKTIFLDEGAYKPLCSGAAVMAPGIYKYRHLITTEIFLNDIVKIDILNKGCIAVGIALMEINKIGAETKGQAIEVLHIEGDELDLKRF
ncbi:hypothetical protein CWI37_0986p0010 [Hamiltosporidium tvaerminnensis]|uniref:PUA domain-containing protein n=2 Tax=Hamiltosporidium TaxID=1176354 RepID=A0A4Q9L796_9MICR|nr:hypothetical protein LUQ84_000847 [Hamiltosporidium tvaerminnensis]TBU00492.1 hypothetical protein CWI37_0986p0010 [Hamiltosporidium tvaerminnensis]TBU03095.1 hypothetical protein CWI36_0988p0010 [Hamiltosporidium magnivora]TBU08622.1 hypothetical protein CWI39_0158p0040 [Hamiltosporidium magnivora]